MATHTTNTNVDLPISGMTCASCANRIERRLNKLDGVTASVNYATEKAKRGVTTRRRSTPEELVEAVEGSRLPRPCCRPADPEPGAG